ncbi:SAM-dependent methyltransferase [Streptomyces sp. NPDC015032]|uniref:SAM-dependent methyltransferase n=1 Tax=Streptomyces sp. NPDC015032 TaxID=3364937 RepID=UPI0036FB964C
MTSIWPSQPAPSRNPAPVSYRTTADNTREGAQRVTPDVGIVYVDHDPIVLAHARALLTSTREGATDYVDADLTDPDAAYWRGAAELFDLLHPGIRWADGTLRVESGCTVTLAVPLVVAVPSLVVPWPRTGAGRAKAALADLPCA